MNPVEAQGLVKIYNGTKALNEVSFHLAPGEVLGLLGPNGAGKTTAIHLLLGLLRPDGGSVSVLGLTPLTDRQQLSRRINFSSAYVQLPFNLTAEDNLRIFAKLYDVPRPKEKVKLLLERFGLTAFARRKTGALSSGEQTRLNLCKALLNDPEVLFLDEPTASLDPDIADRVREELKRVQKERGLSILITSHNMQEVENLCDRVIFLHQGKILVEGPPTEVNLRFGTASLESVFIHLARGGDLIDAEAER